jgi:hypothetical protein
MELAPLFRCIIQLEVSAIIQNLCLPCSNIDLPELIGIVDRIRLKSLPKIVQNI